MWTIRECDVGGKECDKGVAKKLLIAFLRFGATSKLSFFVSCEAVPADKRRKINICERTKLMSDDARKTGQVCTGQTSLSFKGNFLNSIPYISSMYLLSPSRLPKNFVKSAFVSRVYCVLFPPTPTKKTGNKVLQI
jgi:hypothetical protein